eukprot:NODE_1054_length_1140_cov_365.831347_g802_i0.p2 GENE.NODE_1054_length_1140_cov_365.831347_g802_i0~~NODE_1054_length_1140_cov_365.831347_g802_i0.p2  ORF type:complete len:143 (+),score=9.42 NODE_1054_length_1140_cov_365.831347_g802_i0:219-647(+)
MSAKAPQPAVQNQLLFLSAVPPPCISPAESIQLSIGEISHDDAHRAYNNSHNVYPVEQSCGAKNSQKWETKSDEENLLRKIRHRKGLPPPIERISLLKGIEPPIFSCSKVPFFSPEIAVSQSQTPRPQHEQRRFGSHRHKCG